jgi:hypothetical protein
LGVHHEWEAQKQNQLFHTVTPYTTGQHDLLLSFEGALACGLALGRAWAFGTWFENHAALGVTHGLFLFGHSGHDILQLT